MLEHLYAAERALPSLLSDPDGWRSLDINYHPPRVERLYRPWAEGRLMLHRIHPCDRHQALLHPHPWPCAVRVLSGSYEMGIGHGTGVDEPTIAVRVVAHRGMEYSMTDRNAWHTVRPTSTAALTVMVTGPPWERDAPLQPGPLGPLERTAVDEMLEAFRGFYGSESD